MKTKEVFIATLLLVVASEGGIDVSRLPGWFRAIRELDRIVKGTCPNATTTPNTWSRYEVSSYTKKLKITLGSNCVSRPSNLLLTAVLEISLASVKRIPIFGCQYTAYLKVIAKFGTDHKDDFTWIDQGGETVDFTVSPRKGGVIFGKPGAFSCAFAQPELATGSKDFLGIYVLEPKSRKRMAVFFLDVTRLYYEPKVCGFVQDYIDTCGGQQPNTVAMDSSRNLVIDMPGCLGLSQVQLTITRRDEKVDYYGDCEHKHDAALAAKLNGKDFRLTFGGYGSLKGSCSFIHPGNLKIGILKGHLFTFQGKRQQDCGGFYLFNTYTTS